MEACGSETQFPSPDAIILQDISNVTELKRKLNEIIELGKNYKYDISACLQSLLNNIDTEIVCLTIQTIAELSKCETKRVAFAHNDITFPILSIINKEVVCDNLELIKQCCRALGNLCCDCDKGRKAIIETNGVSILKRLINQILDKNNKILDEIKLLTCKIILNFTIGGSEMCQEVKEQGFLDVFQVILKMEVDKSDMSDDLVHTVLLVLGVMSEGIHELVFSAEINSLVLKILKETSDVQVTELCLEHLHTQAEDDSVKLLLAKQGGVQLVCSRLEVLLDRSEFCEMNADVGAIMKQACDLIIIVLNGDDAMNLLYNYGVGEVYINMVKWLNSSNYSLLATAVLAIGNFARNDSNCIQMMNDKIFDKLLDIFEVYHSFAVKKQKDSTKMCPIDELTVTKIQHAVLSALRNLTIPVENKRVAAANGRAAPMLINALPNVQEHHVAYKLLAGIRMLIDGQEGVARLVAGHEAALTAIARWGAAAECAGVAGEAPRLLAWTVRQLRLGGDWRLMLQVDGCISCLVNMLMASHSVMQNEATLALTLLAIDSFNKKYPSTDSATDFDSETCFIDQIIKSEIGKHIAVLIDTNCAKMPLEVSENLLAFLDITAKKNKIIADYKANKVNESLQKFVETRQDLSDDLKACIAGVISLISNNVNL